MADLSFMGAPIQAQEQENSFAPLPQGDYHVQVQTVDLKDTRAGTGKYLSVCFQVVGQKGAGRKLFTNFNIMNPNPKAEEIGRQQLAGFMHAAGMQGNLVDTDQLIGLQASAYVVIKNDEQYGPGNEIKGYKAIQGASAPSAMPQAAPVAQPTQQPQAASAPPWAQQ